MKIIRRFNIGGSWKQDYLSSKDINTVREILRKQNVQVMIECIQDAKEIMGEENLIKNETSLGCLTGIALGLFDKLADPAFTRYQAELDERELMARGTTTETDPEVEKETKELREEKIKEDTSKDEIPIEDQIDDGL